MIDFPLVRQRSKAYQLSYQIVTHVALSKRKFHISYGNVNASKQYILVHTLGVDTQERLKQVSYHGYRLDVITNATNT